MALVARLPPFNPADKLTPLFASGSHSAGYQAMFFQAGRVCLVILRKGLAEDRNGARHHYFDHTSCRRSHGYSTIDPAIAAEYAPGEHNLHTVGVIIHPSQDPDQTDTAQFWQGTAYRAGGFAVQLLRNYFTPSAALAHGFEFRWNTMVLRGHAKHQEGETSALGSVYGDFKKMLDTFDHELRVPGIATLADTRADLDKAQQSIARLKQVVAKQAFNPDLLTKRANDQLARLTQLTEELAHLRLFQTNPDTNDKIAQKKTQATTYLRNQLGKGVREGYLATRVTVAEVDQLEAGLDAGRAALAILRGIAEDTASAERQRELAEAWSARVHEFEQVVQHDGVASAHGPIARAYMDIPVGDSHALLRGCWHLLSSMMATHSHVPEVSYLPNAAYQTALLGLLTREKALFEALATEGVALPMTSSIPQLQQTIDVLTQMDTYWNGIRALSSDQLHLNTPQQIEAELASKFKVELNQRIPFYWFYHHRAPFADQLGSRLDRVLPFMLDCIRLVDQKLTLANQREETPEKVHYREPLYAEQRMSLDQQLFLVMTSYLHHEATTLAAGTAPTPLMLTIKRAVLELVSKERTYGTLEATWTPLLPGKELGTKGSAVDQAMKNAIKASENIDPFHPVIATQIEVLTEQADGDIEGLGTVADAMLAHLRLADEDQAWWDAFRGFSTATNTHLADLNAHIAQIQAQLALIPFNEAAFEADHPGRQAALITRLRRLRVFGTKRSSLNREINAIDLLANPRGDTRENSGIVEVRATLADMQKKLGGLKRTTPLERQMRDAAMHQIRQVETTLMSDPTAQLAKRIRMIRGTLASIAVTSPTLVTDLQAQINTLPNHADFPQLAVDETGCCVALFTNAKDLPTPLKANWKALEVQRAIEEIDAMLQGMAERDCAQWRDAFEYHTAGLDLSLVKREWVTDDHRKQVDSHYAWSKAPVNQDPQFRKNETHLKI